MTVSRREMFVGAAIASTLAASAGVSACSPVPTDHLTAPGQFFALLARGEWVEAKGLLAEGATLSVVSSEGGFHYDNPQAIVELIGQLLTTQGFNMVGDGRDDALGGMYWGQKGNWLCSDMLKGDAVEPSGCGGMMTESLFNVFVDAFAVEGKLKTILLLESPDFALGALAPHREFDAPSQ